MEVPEPDRPKREMTTCVHCGSRVVRQARTDRIPAWTCVSCRREYIDGQAAALNNAVYQSNEVRLYTDGKEICAMIGPDPVQGIAGYGSSVHQALHDLADQLVNCGVWIEVTTGTIPSIGSATNEFGRRASKKYTIARFTLTSAGCGTEEST